MLEDIISQCSIQMFRQFSVQSACPGNSPGNFACVLLLAAAVAELPPFLVEKRRDK